MVKFTKLLCVMALFLFGTANANAANKTIALMPGDWANDGATYAAYVWGGIGEAWFPFVEVGKTGIYATQIPDTYTGMLLARLKPSTASDFKTDNGGLNWDNRWNQSVDYDFTAVDNQTMYTFTGNWDNGEGNSLFTTSTIPPAIILRINLQKIIPIANILGISTTNAVTLINTDASVDDLTNEVASLGTSTKNKANEAIDLAEDFFKKFDATAATGLAPYFEAAKNTINNSTDFDEISTAIQGLAAQVLVQGKDAMDKVDSYLRKMGTLDTDLDKVNAALETKDLKKIMEALRNLKSNVQGAGTTYMGDVAELISEGDPTNEYYSAMQTAYINAISTGTKYQNGSATVIDLGEALLNLIKAVDAYEAANPEVPTGINGITAEKLNNVYNLNGQRVEKAQKGLYIINGKKVLVK